jgi:hypothetical protein
VNFTSKFGWSSCGVSRIDVVEERNGVEGGVNAGMLIEEVRLGSAGTRVRQGVLELGRQVISVEEKFDMVTEYVPLAGALTGPGDF